MKKHRLEIHRNSEGGSLAYLSPITEEGKTTSGYRIAGPKAWGGSTFIASIDISEDDLVEYIKSYATEILAALAPQKN